MRPAKEPAYSKTVCPMLKGSVAANSRTCLSVLQREIHL